MHLLYRTLGFGAIVGGLLILFISYGALLFEGVSLLIIGTLFMSISSLVLSVNNLNSMLIYKKYTEDFLEHLVNKAGNYRIKGDWFRARDMLYSLPKLGGEYFIPVEILSDFKAVEGALITFNLPNGARYSFSIRSINRSDNTEIIEVHKELYVKASALGLALDLSRGIAVVTIIKG